MPQVPQDRLNVKAIILLLVGGYVVIPSLFGILLPAATLFFIR